MNQSAQYQIVAAGAKTDSSKKPPYLKLIADCWEHIFDYLPIDDILSMGRVCKRMSRMAAFYIREFHPNAHFLFKDGEISLCGTNVPPEFYGFIRKLIIWRISDFGIFASTFDSLRTVVFRHLLTINKTDFECMRNILKNIENIKLSEICSDCDIFEQIAIHCPKLKRLVINRNDTDCTLYAHNYPALESVSFIRWSNVRSHNLKMFLENHSKLQRFYTCADVLWKNRDLLLQTNVRLDSLDIDVAPLFDRIQMDQFVDLLRTLYSRCFYKNLKLVTILEFELLINAIPSFPALREFCDLALSPRIDFTRLTNLKKLDVHGFVSVAQAEITAKSLIKLEQLLVFQLKEIDEILPFIRYSRNLKSIEMYNLGAAAHKFDSFALNEERRKLEYAAQLSVHLPQDIYLAEKWKTRNLKLDRVRIVCSVYLESF